MASVTADGQWCPDCGEPRSACQCTCFEDDDEAEVCIHGVPWCEECSFCDEEEDELDVTRLLRLHLRHSHSPCRAIPTRCPPTRKSPQKTTPDSVTL